MSLGIQRFKAWLVFLASLIFLSFLQPWGSFRDQDSFYHAKLADIILHGASIPGVQGIHAVHLFFLQNFPWLDLTLLGDRFVDQHLFYHLALTPFVAAFGMFDGLQIATVLFAALFVTLFFKVLERLSVQHPLLWTTLAVLSMPLSFRLSLGKASPFALAAFVMGLAAMLRTTNTKRERIACHAAAFIAGLIFSLSHGGWIILLVSQALYILGGWIFDRYVTRSKIAWVDAQIFLTTALGIAAGLIIHPNRANLLPFLYTQIVQVALATHASTQLGLEWGPATMGDIAANLGPLIMAGAAVLLGLVLAPRRPLDTKRARSIVSLGIILAALTAFTLKSSRMIEYLVPVFALWLGSLWSLVDPVHFKQELRAILQKKERTIYIGALILMIAVCIRDVRGTYHGLREGARPFNRLAPIVEVLNREATPGERIFHDRWDSFGELFALAPQFRYISGVDPTFLLAKNPTLGAEYERITVDKNASITGELQARISLLERTETCRPAEAKILVKDGRSILCR